MSSERTFAEKNVWLHFEPGGSEPSAESRSRDSIPDAVYGRLFREYIGVTASKAARGSSFASKLFLIRLSLLQAADLPQTPHIAAVAFYTCKLCICILADRPETLRKPSPELGAECAFLKTERRKTSETDLLEFPPLHSTTKISLYTFEARHFHIPSAPAAGRSITAILLTQQQILGRLLIKSTKRSEVDYRPLSSCFNELPQPLAGSLDMPEEDLLQS